MTPISSFHLCASYFNPAQIVLSKCESIILFTKTSLSFCVQCYQIPTLKARVWVTIAALATMQCLAETLIIIPRVCGSCMCCTRQIHWPQIHDSIRGLPPSSRGSVSDASKFRLQQARIVKDVSMAGLEREGSTRRHRMIRTSFYVYVRSHYYARHFLISALSKSINGQSFRIHTSR